MTRRMRAILGGLAVAVTLVGGGCATTLAHAANASLPQTNKKPLPPYTGTRVDAVGVAAVGESPLISLACLVDLPLSLALDTALLPYQGARALFAARPR